MTGGGQAARLWAPHAWVQGRWQAQVLMSIDATGFFHEVQFGVATPPEGAAVLAGPVLPGLVNAHSHAFQRAFAGLAERREGEHDNFWSWRDRMYRVALRISPAQLRAVARQLYLEMLRGGYTQVCEFHYLHHDPDGQPYAGYGGFTNFATFDSDTSPEPKEGEAPAEIVPAADLAITKTAAAKVAPDGSLTYGLHVENHGPSVAHRVKVTDPLPAGVDFVSVGDSDQCAKRL